MNPILDSIASGKPTITAIKEEMKRVYIKKDRPTNINMAAFLKAVRRNPTWLGKYEDARKARDIAIQEINEDRVHRLMDMVDDAITGDKPVDSRAMQAAKSAIEWHASKVNRDRYGERVNHSLEVGPRLADLLSNAYRDQDEGKVKEIQAIEVECIEVAKPTRETSLPHEKKYYLDKLPTAKRSGSKQT